MEYSNWRLRKQVMSEPSLSISQRFYGLVVIDNVDWSSGKKMFASRNHMANWFAKLAEVNGIDEDALDDALKAMKEAGMAEMDRFTLVLRSEG